MSGVKTERLHEADDWFAETAKDMDLELDKEMADIAVNDILAMIKGEN